ncbi:MULTISPECIES: GNAT family N-acetyltransferase [Ramlibacter]|uniref:GNAT family N-acetyltransferase n=1 Tax=Ramlibacter pinisoli TaxID=2682844 RepID=A0A6N8IVM4_9BURK|nr:MULTISPECIES: GNAT family N-acetyltransferase [Ramlibacter]MBA2965215.1 GNAT family N-acetyltransferase [Ramlibacter sp. CGMCC 1.13660]MVQ30180.1 GNAT family N-acetyltransferase [Ramlibacter pinisoli]
MAAGYVTRTMRPDEVALAIEWAAQEGWNPGLHDAQTFLAADPQGFFVGTLDGEPVASVSVVRYEPGFAFLGLYIVRPGWRGRGLGWALWQHGMASAAGRLVGLDGVVAQQANYRRSGFELAWRNVRYEGRGGGAAPADARLVDLAGVPFEAVRACDAACFPAERSAFLRAWLAQPDAAARGWIEDGRLQGYGVVRRCRSGWKIGPLVAGSEAVAEALFLALCAPAGAAEPVYLDVPEPHAAAVALARRHGMQVVFETARMYTGRAPAVPLDSLYGVTTFELG